MNYYFSSTLFRKTLAALSGIFLITFLLGHLAGNLQLILLAGEAAQKQFNTYAKFMTSNPVVKLLSYLTYGSILLHTLLTIYLARQAKSARPVDYEVSGGGANSTWSSRNMPLLGVITLVFIVIHMKSFWYEMHFGVLGNDPWGNKDLYTLTVTAFKEAWYSFFYIVCMIILAFHLKHGIESSFQTLGLKTRKYAGCIRQFSVGLAVIVPLAFALIPIILFFQS